MALAREPPASSSSSAAHGLLRRRIDVMSTHVCTARAGPRRADLGSSASAFVVLAVSSERACSRSEFLRVRTLSCSSRTAAREHPPAQLAPNATHFMVATTGRHEKLREESRIAWGNDGRLTRHELVARGVKAAMVWSVQHLLRRMSITGPLIRKAEDDAARTRGPDYGRLP